MNLCSCVIGVLCGLGIEETRRDCWGHDIYSKGEFNNLFLNLKKETKTFYGYFRINREIFDCILDKKLLRG